MTFQLRISNNVSVVYLHHTRKSLTDLKNTHTMDSSVRSYIESCVVSTPKRCRRTHGRDVTRDHVMGACQPPTYITADGTRHE